MVQVFNVLFVFILLILGSYFSACETALTAYSKPKMFSLAQNGNKQAKIIMELQNDIDLVLSTILICYTILSSFIVSLFNLTCLEIFGESAIYYGPIIVSIFIILFAELLPKMLTIKNPEKILLPSANFIKFLYKSFKLVSWTISLIAKSIIKLLHIKSKTKQEEYSDSLKELKGAIDLHITEDENETKQERDMLNGILELGAVPVSHVMVHKKNVTMICADDDIKSITQQVLNCQFTRIPLWENNQDNIIGILHVKDFLKAIKSHSEIKIKDILLPPCFIPENKDLLDQLQSFKMRHEHFAIVIDEYGYFMGILTLEDIIEEIVGNIEDEHDTPKESGVIKSQDGTWIVNGSINIRDLNREINANFKSENASTIAGFVIESIGIIPEINRTFIINNYKFVILKKYKNQITLIKIQKL